MPIPSATSAALVSALRERLAVIADRKAYNQDPAAHLGRLQTASQKIVDLAAQLPPATNSQLMHYLQRCSYDKALTFLEDEVT